MLKRIAVIGLSYVISESAIIDFIEFSMMSLEFSFDGLMYRDIDSITLIYI